MGRKYLFVAGNLVSLSHVGRRSRLNGFITITKAAGANPINLDTRDLAAQIRQGSNFNELVERCFQILVRRRNGSLPCCWRHAVVCSSDTSAQQRRRNRPAHYQGTALCSFSNVRQLFCSLVQRVIVQWWQQTLLFTVHIRAVQECPGNHDSTRCD